MPLYEYRCAKCGNVFEVLQKFSDEPLTQHEGCGGSVERLISAPGLQFKGTGWYITDYARAGSSGKSKSDGGSEKKSESKSSESKSESSSESKSTPAPASTKSD